MAVKDLDGDAKADLVTGAGTAAGSRVTGYLGTVLGVLADPTAAFSIATFDDLTNGVFVGSPRADAHLKAGCGSLARFGRAVPSTPESSRWSSPRSPSSPP